MRKKMRNCIVCGKEYEYCNSCRSHASFPAWMAIYHNENCRNIMSIATEYMAGNLTKTEAKNKLDGCDLTDKRSFKESVAKVVNEICTTKKVNKTEKESIKKPDVEIDTETKLEVEADLVETELVNEVDETQIFNVE